ARSPASRPVARRLDGGTRGRSPPCADERRDVHAAAPRPRPATRKGQADDRRPLPHHAHQVASLHLEWATAKTRQKLCDAKTPKARACAGLQAKGRVQPGMTSTSIGKNCGAPPSGGGPPITSAIAGPSFSSMKRSKASRDSQTS